MRKYFYKFRSCKGTFVSGFKIKTDKYTPLDVDNILERVKYKPQGLFIFKNQLTRRTTISILFLMWPSVNCVLLYS